MIFSSWEPLSGLVLCWLANQPVGWAAPALSAEAQRACTMLGFSGASPESAQPALGGPRPARPCTAWIENGFSAIADPEIAHRDQFVVFVYQRAANAQPRRHARLLEQVAQFARVRIAGGFDPFAAATEVDGQRRVEHRRPCCCRVHGFEPQPA